MVPASAGGLADLAGVVERDPLAVAGQRLADGGELDDYLGLAVLGQPGVGQAREQVEVGVAGGAGLGLVEGVLTEVVEGHQPLGPGELGGARRRPRWSSPAT